MRKKLKQLIFPLLLIVFTGLLLKPLFTSNLLYTDDGELHAARVANYYLAIKQGQIPPRLAPNLNSGYGYPVFNFVYPLAYIISTIIYMALPITIVLSLNLTVVLLTIAGTLGIYYLARQFSLSSWRSTLAAILYLTAPYTLINIYSRTSLGEISFFAALPWVMWGVEHFMRTKKTKPISSLVLIITLSLLLLTHQTSTLFAAIILVIYYYFRLENKQSRLTLIKRTTPAIIISLLLTSWYWLPAILEKQYIVLDRTDIITNYLTQFPKHWSFFFHKIISLERLNTFRMVSIGYSSWIIILSSLWLAINKKLKDKKITWYLLGVAALTIILMMPFTRSLWLISGLGNYLQYPWRLLSILTICTVLLFMHLLQTQSFKNNHWLTGVIIFTSALSVFVYAHPRGFQSWSDYELFEYFKTTTTFNEFQPIWSAEYMRHFPAEKISLRTPGEELYLDEALQPANYASLEIQNWNGSQMQYIINTENKVEVIQKTAYFPGWELSVNGKPHEIVYQDEEFPGHITYSLDPGEHQIKLRFAQYTPARKVGSGLTLAGAITLALYLFTVKKRNAS